MKLFIPLVVLVVFTYSEARRHGGGHRRHHRRGGRGGGLDVEELFHEVFKNVDTDKDQGISMDEVAAAAEEIKRVASTFLEKHRGLEGLLKTVFGQLDHDGDGKVTKREFAGSYKAVEKIVKEILGVAGDDKGGYDYGDYHGY